MSEQEEFFSPQHDRLLSIATWSKYLAWVVLAFYILSAALVIINEQRAFQQSGFAVIQQSYWQALLHDPIYYGLKIVLPMAGLLLEGAVGYVILKGISLGLNMIVETDINYRENAREAGNEQ